MTIMLASRPDLPAEAKAQIEATIARYKATVARYESDPREGGGKRELSAKAKHHETARELAQSKDPYFDYSQAFLQIAIVLASVSLVTGSTILLAASFALSVAGAFLLLNGYTLFARMAFLE